jgi:hypothetical protein
MFEFIGTIFKSAAKIQDSGKMRENDAENSRKATYHQNKVCVQRLQPKASIAVISMLCN